MKFLRFLMADPAKATELSQLADKFVGVGVFEMENAEAMTATSYPALLAGANLWWVPVQEVPVGGAVEAERQMKG